MHSFEFSIFLIIIVDRFTVSVIFYTLLLSYCLMYSFVLFCCTLLLKLKKTSVIEIIVLKSILFIINNTANNTKLHA